MKLPATLVCVVLAAAGCETKKPVPVDAKVADASGLENSGGCEEFCIQGDPDAGVCMTGCADAGAGGIAVCPTGCEVIG